VLRSGQQFDGHPDRYRNARHERFLNSPETIRADQRLGLMPIIRAVLDDFSRRDRTRPAGRFP